MSYPSPFEELYNKVLKDNLAINTNDKNVLISASAGTGKTFILVNRLIKRILNRELEIDDVIIMTFNETAAAELREKIMKALVENRDASSKETKEYLNRQIAKLPSANISTIHAFCFDIVKKHSYAINLDPASIGAVMDDSDEELFKSLTLTYLVKNKKEYAELVLQTSTKPLDTEMLDECLNDLYKLRSNYKNYDKWKNKVLEDYDLMAKGKVPKQIEEFFIKDYRKKVEDAIEVTSELKEIAVDNRPKSKKASEVEDFYDMALNNLNAFLKNLDNMSLVYGEDFYDARRIPRLNSETDEEIKNRYKKLKTFYLKANSILKDNEKAIRADWIVAQAQLSHPYVKKILYLADTYYEYFEDLKKSHNLISFDDMSKLALQILEDKDVVQSYKDRYKEIMVDEYQDSSYDQEEIIQRISRGNNVFRVGDLKQSIYGFRNAKPEIMQGLIDKADKDDLILHQQTNYRSDENILEFNNYIFDNAFNTNQPGTYSSKNEDLKLPKDKNCDNLKIRMCLCEEEGNIKEKREKLMKAIAQEIKTRVKNQENSYGDFCILVSKNKYKAKFINLLNAYDMPYHATFDHGFFNDVAVSSVISILKLMSNKYDRINMVNVLRGPIYSMTDEEIAKYYKDENNKENKEDICKEVYNLLKQLDECKDVYEIMATIYGENEWYVNKTTLAQRDNLDQLFQLVVDYQKNQSGLLNLINYLDKLKGSDISEATSTSTQDNVIQIMTIHQAKGLSRKVVYITDFKDKEQPYKKPLRFDEKYGVGMHYVYDDYNVRVPSTYHAFINKRKQKEEFDERLRVYYVALTRPEKELNIAYLDNKEIKDTELTYDSLYNKPLSYIIRLILKTKPNKNIENMIEYVNLEVQDESNFIEIKKSSKKADLYSNKKEKTKEEKVKSENSYYYAVDYSQPNATDRGTIMHKAIELLKIKDIKEKDIDDLNLPMSDTDKEKVMNFYKNDFTKQLINNNNYHEYPFMSKSNASNNIIDLLSINDKEVYIIDFKSDKNTSEKKLIKDHQRQLIRYYNAISKVKELKDKKVSTIIYSFDLDKYVEVPIDAEQQG